MDDAGAACDVLLSNLVSVRNAEEDTRPRIYVDRCTAGEIQGAWSLDAVVRPHGLVWVRVYN